MITFQEECLAECLEEAKPLLYAHWQEIAHNKEKIPYCPAWDRYYKMEELGFLHIVTAREDGKLIGYFVSIVTSNLHYSTTLMATNDILYIVPEKRGTSLGYRLFKEAERRLKDMGVKSIVIHMKVYAAFDNLLEKLGYTNVERMYSKYIGE